MTATTGQNPPITGTREDSILRSRRLLRRLMATLVLVVVLPASLVVYRCQQFLNWVDDVEARGGQVDTETGEHNWLRDVVGDRRMKYFDEVWNVRIDDATDNDLRRLARLKRLSEDFHLFLRNPRLSPSGWEQLVDLRALQSLDISGDASLLQNRSLLPRLESLEYLSIMNVSLSGTSEIENLELLPRLSQPLFVDVALSHAQIEALAGLTQLEGLAIIGTPIEREDVVALQRLTELRSLNFIDANLSADAIPELAAFKRLEYLSLTENLLPSDALKPLGELKMLKTLFLTNMTPTGEVLDVSALQSALPDCEIRMSSMDGEVP